jgi:RNA polymerase sigma-70 factor (ECF subfamily)
LLQRCAERDPVALREIVERYQRRLFGYLSRMLGSAEDAEEATQDVFLRVWEQASRFEGRASFATWLYRIATNVAYDMLRRRKAQRRRIHLAEPAAYSVDAEAQALAGLEQEERTRHLQSALQTLRAQDRILLILYYQEEMSYEEICGITGCSHPVVKVRLLRARQRLRGALEPLTRERME